jgi:L-lactate dehydrogenase
MLAERQIDFDDFRQEIERDVRYANIAIIEGSGASQYGIGIVASRIAEVVLRDERAVFPAGSHYARYGTTLSLPSVVGRCGVSEVLWPEMSEEERQGIDRSAETIRKAVQKFVPV